MAFTTSTSPTEDIIVAENGAAYSYTCSGNIFAGQGVYIVATDEVKAPGSCADHVYTAACVGVADYDQTDDNKIMIWGPGNIVRVVISGATHCTLGQVLVMVSEGKFAHKDKYGTLASGIRAIALETQATADGAAKVLLY